MTIVTIVGRGGLGKSSLVGAWAKRLVDHPTNRYQAIFAWSFYGSWSAGDTNEAARAFFVNTLNWFGDESPTSGNDESRMVRLLRIMQTQPILLILDGIEFLQHPPGSFFGELRNDCLRVFLRELAASHQGLCLVTSRAPVTDLRLSRSLRPIAATAVGRGRSRVASGQGHRWERAESPGRR